MIPSSGHHITQSISHTARQSQRFYAGHDQAPVMCLGLHLQVNKDGRDKGCGDDAPPVGFSCKMQKVLLRILQLGSVHTCSELRKLSYILGWYAIAHRVRLHT